MVTGQFGGDNPMQQSGDGEIIQFYPGQIESMRIGFTAVDQNEDGFIDK